MATVVTQMHIIVTLCVLLVLHSSQDESSLKGRKSSVGIPAIYQWPVVISALQFMKCGWESAFYCILLVDQASQVQKLMQCKVSIKIPDLWDCEACDSTLHCSVCW